MECDNTNRSSDIKNEEESSAVSSSNESELRTVPVQKLTISEKIFADGREVGISVLEENCGSPEFLVFPSDDDPNNPLSKKKKGEKILLQCTLCSYSTYKKSSYEKHFVVHCDEKPFACSLCSYKAKRKDILKRHILGKHYPLSSSLECTECNFNSVNKKQLMKHMLKHLGENLLDFEEHYSKNQKNDGGEHSNTEDISKPFKCLMCDFETKYTFSFNRHMLRRHTDVQPLHCEKCDFVTNEKNELESHLLECSEGNFKAIPQKRSSLNMVEHASEHQSDCEEKSTENQKDDKDKLSNTKDVTEIYKCSLCNFKTKYKMNMERHISRRHTDVQPLHCKECDFVTNEKNKLESHLLECSEGNFKTIPQKKRSSLHMLDLSNEHQLDCEEKDTEIQNDDKDKLSNTKDVTEIYKCSWCDFVTKYKKSMERHVSRKHTDVQTLHRSECDLVTNEKNSLECSEGNLRTAPNKWFSVHSILDYEEGVENQKTHSKDITKLVKCSKCDFETKYTYSLNRHISRKHSGAQSFHCSEFDFATNKKNKLECPEGNFNTIPKKQFNIQMLDHSNEDKSICEENDIENHENTKDIIKPFKCPQCDFETKYKKNLSRHISRKHTHVQPLHCSKCDFITNEKDKLDCHLQECPKINFILVPEKEPSVKVEHSDEEKMDLHECPEVNFKLVPEKELCVKKEHSDEEKMDYEGNDIENQESNVDKLLKTEDIKTEPI